ncbi:Hypothetical predicted protein [Prunus dulcis]|uniref:Uncharacterized protein n=1 Tax=Prunus dulcis TaxID=3755 RepID=A0A5E4GAE5_PRUDU|nr:Hypothetical predicted protein [Prunus dulcis]
MVKTFRGGITSLCLFREQSGESTTKGPIPLLEHDWFRDSLQVSSCKCHLLTKSTFSGQPWSGQERAAPFSRSSRHQQPGQLVGSTSLDRPKGKNSLGLLTSTTKKNYKKSEKILKFSEFFLINTKSCSSLPTLKLYTNFSPHISCE